MKNLLTLEQELRKCRRNSCIMKKLFEADFLPIENSSFLYTTPPEIGRIRLSKVEGLLLGTAIGDVLGNKYESLIPDQKSPLAPIASFHPNAHITDDTQLSFIKLEVLLSEGWFNPEVLAKRIVKERIIGIGHSVKTFIRKFKDLKYPWFVSGVKSAGNGGLFLAPIPIPHVHKPSFELWCDTVVTTRLIYWDRLAISSAVAFMNIVWKCLKMTEPPEEDWWIEEYIKVARDLEGDSSRYSTRYGEKYSGPAWYFVEKVLKRALEKRMSVHELSNSIGSGAYLLETVPVTLYILAIRAYNPVLALLDAVTYTKDSDTIGAIVGYIVGALHGIRGFPGYLVKPLLREKLPRKYLELLISSEEILKRGSVEDDGIVNGYGFESPKDDDPWM